MRLEESLSLGLALSVVFLVSSCPPARRSLLAIEFHGFPQRLYPGEKPQDQVQDPGVRVVIPAFGTSFFIGFFCIFIKDPGVQASCALTI